MRKAVTIFSIILFLSGLGLMLYPFISDQVNKKNATQVIEDFDKNIENMDKEEIDVIKEAAKKYNEQLSSVVSADELKDSVSYKDIYGENQVIGYIVIPKIDVNLPIYSGTDEKVLKKGVGHMTQTSYPLGGVSTHCALTGHRGLPSATLFTDLDELEMGDEFYLHVMDEVLAYRVDKIDVVEPTEGDGLQIVEGQDYCTLVTCTPYAINSHRLLVRGTRTEYIGEQKQTVNNQLQSGSFTKRVVDVWPWLLVVFSIIAICEGTLFILIIRRKRKDKLEE